MTTLYKKSLRLLSSARQTHGVGQITNYMVVDAQQLSDACLQLHLCWSLPLQVIIALVLLYQIIGIPAFAGIATMIVITFITFSISQRQKHFQGLLMRARDRRMKSITEVLAYMKVIKLQAWEEKFAAFLQKMRDVECKWLYETQRKRNYATVIYWSMPTIVTSFVLATCILLEMELTYTLVFTVLATFRIIQDPIRSVPDVLSTLIQAKVSLQRLDAFLEEDELSDSIVKRDRSGKSEYAVIVDSAYLSWDPDALKPSLRDINIVIKRGQKVAVCGTIGSGKSTLLQALLGEIPKLSGKVNC